MVYEMSGLAYTFVCGEVLCKNQVVRGIYVEKDRGGQMKRHRQSVKETEVLLISRLINYFSMNTIAIRQFNRSINTLMSTVETYSVKYS